MPSILPNIPKVIESKPVVVEPAAESSGENSFDETMVKLSEGRLQDSTSDSSDGSDAAGKKQVDEPVPDELAVVNGVAIAIADPVESVSFEFDTTLEGSIPTHGEPIGHRASRQTADLSWLQQVQKQKLENRRQNGEGDRSLRGTGNIDSAGKIAGVAADSLSTSAALIEQKAEGLEHSHLFGTILDQAEGDVLANVAQTSAVDALDVNAYKNSNDGFVSNTAPGTFTQVQEIASANGKDLTQVALVNASPAVQVQEVLKVNLNPHSDDSLQTISIELHPAELGELLVRVEMGPDKLVAQILAAEFAAAELLLNEKDFLLEALSDLGFDEASLDISHGETTAEHGDDQSDGKTLAQSKQESNQVDGTDSWRKSTTGIDVIA